MTKREANRLMCEALLFDLDGVLVDSRECVENTWRTWAARHGFDADAVLRIAHGRRATDVVRVMSAQLNVERELAALIAHESTATDGLREVNGALPLLRALPATRWAIVTSGVRSVAEHRLRWANLPIPTVMVCADEVRKGKPEPEGYLAAAARLGISRSDCIVIEDAPAGIAAARTAGMRSIGLATTHSASDLRDADAVVDALDALTIRVSETRQAQRVEVWLTRV